jgi:hypothetical protein
MKLKTTKDPRRSVNNQGQPRAVAPNWSRWFVAQLLVLVVSAGGTITVTVGHAEQIQVQVLLGRQGRTGEPGR